MDYLRARLAKALISHFEDDDRRIDHALRVTAWAERIMALEGGDPEVVLSVGMLHDAGIKEAESRGESPDGKLQETYGPPIVRRILQGIGLPPKKINLCCEIVAHHHTPAGIPGIDFAILWDADMLVNLRDDVKLDDPEKWKSIIEKSFRTGTGKELAREEFIGG